MTNSTGGGDGSDTIDWDHPNIPFAIWISLGAGLATGLGGSLVFAPELLKRVPQAQVLAISLALSSGVMIYVSFIEIFAKSLKAIESLDYISEGGAAAITTTCFFAGMLFCALLEVLVHYKCPAAHADACVTHGGLPTACNSTTTASAASSGEKPAQADEKAVKVDIVSGDAAGAEGELIGNAEESGPLSRMGVMTALAIAIHNFPEGLATFMATLEDTKLGASLGVAIAVHNIPEGLCVAMPIYYATGSKWKGFFWSVLSGITEPIGGILGFAALQPVFTELVFGIVFSMVGGMMVFIVCHEMLPAAHRYMGNGAKTTAYLIGGMLIMAISLILFVL